MSVAVSTGFSLDDLDNWRRDMRAKVTALKCQVMASKGLTIDGRIVEPYSPDCLLESPSNAKLLEGVDMSAVSDFVTKKQTGDVSPNEDPHSITPLVNGHRPLPLEDLKEALERTRQEMKQKEEEVLRLSKIRDEVESELQELTANLFQEAHSMVQEANQRAAAAEKSLKEATMQIEVLQAEVTALKALVITSTPSSPNTHLHPQLCKSSLSDLSSGKKNASHGHRKFPSDFDLKYGRDITPPSSPLKEGRFQDTTTDNRFALDPECWEIDPVAHKEFVSWKQDPVLDRSHPFMNRVYCEDIDLCLTFPNSGLANLVQQAIEDNVIFIEEVNPRQKSSCPKTCVLLEVPRFCKYRFRLGDDEEWYYISLLARNRIIAVCDFLNYLRYIKQGLVKSSVHDVYWEIVKLRKQMCHARLGF